MAGGIDAATLELLQEKEMPKLRRLHIIDSEGANELLGAFSRVQAVNITEEIDELPGLCHLSELEELHLSLIKSPPLDFGQLLRPEKLRALTINVTTNVTGLETLINLEYLNPGDSTFSETDLSELLTPYANLLFLDLSQAKVESLRPLTNNPALEAVALGDFMTDGDPDFSPLGDLPKLRYVALTDDLHESGAAAAIRDVCPQAVIYWHYKFCLGSGWLLLFLPVLLILPFAKRARSKMRRGT
jgi:hypothetical protein